MKSAKKSKPTSMANLAKQEALQMYPWNGSNATVINRDTNHLKVKKPSQMAS